MRAFVFVCLASLAIAANIDLEKTVTEDAPVVTPVVDAVTPQEETTTTTEEESDAVAALSAQVAALQSRLHNLESLASPRVSVFGRQLALFSAAASSPLAPSLLGEPAVAAVEALRTACAADVATLCHDVHAQDSTLVADRAQVNMEATMCLAANEGAVSDACLEAAHGVYTIMRTTADVHQKMATVAVQEAYDSFSQSCTAEISNFCPAFPASAPLVPSSQAAVQTEDDVRRGPFLRRLREHPFRRGDGSGSGSHHPHHRPMHSHHDEPAPVEATPEATPEDDAQPAFVAAPESRRLREHGEDGEHHGPPPPPPHHPQDGMPPPPPHLNGHPEDGMPPPPPHHPQDGEHPPHPHHPEDGMPPPPYHPEDGEGAFVLGGERRLNGKHHGHGKHHHGKHHGHGRKHHHRRLHDFDHHGSRHHPFGDDHRQPASPPTGPVADLRSCAMQMSTASPQCAAAADNYHRVSAVVFPEPRGHRWGGPEEEGEDYEEYGDDWEDHWHHHGGPHHDGGGFFLVVIVLALTAACCCIRRRRKMLRRARMLAFSGRSGGPSPPVAPPAPPSATQAAAGEAEHDSLLTPQAPVSGRPVVLVAQPTGATAPGVVMGTPVYPTYTDYERN